MDGEATDSEGMGVVQTLGQERVHTTHEAAAVLPLAHMECGDVEIGKDRNR